MPDSAATASAMYSGVKTMGYSMGFDSSIITDDPTSQMPGEAQEVTTVFTWAQEAGKSTGTNSPCHLYKKTVNITVFP